MAYCSNCGNQISDSAVACPKCGHPGPGAAPAVDLTRLGGPVANAPLAEWGTRVGAYLIDAVIIVGILLLLLALGIATESLGPFLLLGSFALVSVVYKPVMEGARGQTLGKMALNIRVVRASDAGPIGYGEAFMRWFIMAIAGFVPLGTLVDLLWPLWDRYKQCLHDKVAKTIVVKA
ncbi:MAG TPA: RDD family protein [Actinomycetota bacterium]